MSLPGRVLGAFVSLCNACSGCDAQAINPSAATITNANLTIFHPWVTLTYQLALKLPDKADDPKQRCAGRGFGWAELPRAMLERFGKDLVQLGIIGYPRSVNIDVAWSRRSPLGLAGQRFLDQMLIGTTKWIRRRLGGCDRSLPTLISRTHPLDTESQAEWIWPPINQSLACQRRRTVVLGIPSCSLISVCESPARFSSCTCRSFSTTAVVWGGTSD